jgi:hypothetical protein
VRPAAQLWHYTSLDALKKILESKKLRLRRLDAYWKDDPFEGSVPNKQIEDQVAIFSSRNMVQMMSVVSHYPDMSMPPRRELDPWTELTLRRQAMARSIHVSCWTKGESEVMWRLYCAEGADGERKADGGQKGYGVALQTTFRKMNTFVERHDLIASQVQYRRYDVGDAFDHDLDPFFHKRKNFRIEREVRLLKFDERHYLQLTASIASNDAAKVAPPELDECISLDWSPAKVINRIWISPYASDGYAEKVRDAIKSIDPSMSNRVKLSRLRELYPAQR